MKKLIALTLTATMLTVTAAQADYRHRAPAPRYQPQHHHQHRGTPNWVAPVISGLLLGGAVYGAHRYYQPSCWTEFVGYDRYGREVYQEFCR